MPSFSGRDLVRSLFGASADAPGSGSVRRFKEAQGSSTAGFETALAELQAGRKRGHWIWYIFPQIEGLGQSPYARMYALRDRQEAIDFLQDPLLRSRLTQLIEVVDQQLARGARLTDLMGARIDALKLVSSVTLFEIAIQAVKSDRPADDARFAETCRRVLAAAEAQGFPRCAHTLERVRP